MFENLMNIFKKNKKNKSLTTSSKNTAKERLHLVLMQDRANVSADFLDLMRKEIIEVIKKYIDIDEKAMDVRLTTETNEDGTQGAPALYANIPIINIKDETRKLSKTNQDHKIEIKLTETKKKIEKQKNLEAEEKEDNKDNESKTYTPKHSNSEKEEKIEDSEANNEESNTINNTKESIEKKESIEHESQNKEEENNNEE